MLSSNTFELLSIPSKQITIFLALFSSNTFVKTPSCHFPFLICSPIKFVIYSSLIDIFKATRPPSCNVSASIESRICVRVVLSVLDLPTKIRHFPCLNFSQLSFTTLTRLLVYDKLCSSVYFFTIMLKFGSENPCIIFISNLGYKSFTAVCIGKLSSYLDSLSKNIQNACMMLSSCNIFLSFFLRSIAESITLKI